MKLLVFLSLASCAHPLSPPGSGLSPTEELDLGEAGLAVLSVQPGIYRNQRLDDLVTRVGSRLAEIAPGPRTHYRFYVLDTDQMTALALPGGLVFISRGLLATMESEDELAGVLGHEIGHVASRHASRRASLRLGQELMGSVTRWVAGLFNLDAKRSELFFDSISARHSRSQEREADRVGVALAMSLGYRGEALATVLKRIGDSEAARAPMFLTHPTTPERLAIIETVVENMTRGSGRPTLTPSAFVSAMDGMPLGPSASNGFVSDGRYVSGDGAYAVQFPSQWTVELGLNGPVGTSPDWQGVISIQTVSTEPAPEGKHFQAGGRSVFVSEEGGMTAYRSRFLAAGREYELAGLWNADSSHAGRYVELLGSLRFADCDSALSYETRILRVEVENGVAVRRESPHYVVQWPPGCDGR
ncbi:MAG: M48 family metalloprotease [Myxococcota bacterium]